MCVHAFMTYACKWLHLHHSECIITGQILRSQFSSSSSTLLRPSFCCLRYANPADSQASGWLSRLCLPFHRRNAKIQIHATTSSSSMWVSGSHLGLQASAASAFTHWTISPAPGACSGDLTMLIQRSGLFILKIVLIVAFFGDSSSVLFLNTAKYSC